MNKLRAVIFGVRNLILRVPEGAHTGEVDEPSMGEFGRLLTLLRDRGIEPVLFANSPWSDSESKKPFDEELRERWGEFRSFITERDGMPKKPKAEAMQALLRKLGLQSNEVLYVGNSEHDMRAAVNGGVLFLNGTWLSDSVEYGFKFSTIKDVARFVDVFCVREHGWHFAIEEPHLGYFALAPFSTRYAEYENYSSSARSLAKDRVGDPDFWGKYLCATLFFSGLYKSINYVCPFPSHRAHTWHDPLRASIDAFVKCFRKSYLPDLVLRHTDAIQSHRNRGQVDHLVHLNSVHLTERPTKKGSGERYARCPLSSSKTVLVIDDFCTRGFSLEAARLYLQQAGCNVVLVTWLKTINRDYSQLTTSRRFNPFVPNTWSKADFQLVEHPYRGSITDDQASAELSRKLSSYETWDWPR